VRRVMDRRPEGVLGQRPAVRRAIDDSGSVMRFRIDAIAPSARAIKPSAARKSPERNCCHANFTKAAT